MDKRKKLRRRTDTLLLKDFRAHIQADADSFGKMNDLLSKTATKEDITKLNESIAPMLQIFNENKIVRMRLSSDAQTIFFYAGGITGVGYFGYQAIHWLKTLFNVVK